MACKKDLRTAALEFDVQCIRELLSRGGNPNARFEDGMTPLHYVALNCRGDVFARRCVEAARVLLAHGADPKAVNVWGVTPLHYAAYSGSAELVRLLLDYGADPNALDGFRRTPLHMAALNEFVSPDVVKLLLERGANPAVADVYGRTPIDYAERFGRYDIVQILTGRAPQQAAPRQQEVSGRRRSLFERFFRRKAKIAA